MSRLQQKSLDVLWVAECDSDKQRLRNRRLYSARVRWHDRALLRKARELARRGYIRIPDEGSWRDAWLTQKGRDALWHARNLGYRPVAK